MPWTVVGQVGVVGLCVISVLLGWLVPRSIHKEHVALWKQRSEDYKAAWETEKAINATHAETLRQLLKYAETTDQLQRAILARAGDIL